MELDSEGLVGLKQHTKAAHDKAEHGEVATGEATRPKMTFRFEGNLKETDKTRGAS